MQHLRNGFQEIKAITAKENYASQKLLKRLGFEFQGLTNSFNDTEEYLFRIKRSA
jgi:RimJ/RimL family protein N-acetyltransferase